ncbi:MAG: DHHW family protein [Propionibacteriaceae bacterium]|nr:DHHW family protein [Propionibacteriaceae bacterium]
MTNLRAIASTVAFALVLAGGGLVQLFAQTPDMLRSERRQLAAMPALSSLVDQGWMEGFEDFVADRFPGRDGFRALKAFTVLKAFRQSDLDGLYLADGHAGKFEPVNVASATRMAEKIKIVAAGLESQRLYYAIVPDKSYYTSRNFPGYDRLLVHQLLSERLSDLTEIDLTQALNLDAYYSTDLHWDQSRITPVVAALGEAMGFDASYTQTLQSLTAGSFSGVYASQLALPLLPDVMTYLTSASIDQSTANYLNPQTGLFEPAPIYQLDLFEQLDPYNLYMAGSQPLIVLENPAATTERELVLFRDSFGSALAPLLLPAYRKITVIDLRYLHIELLDQYLQVPPAADVLFVYSSQILNNSDTLMVPIR